VTGTFHNALLREAAAGEHAGVLRIKPDGLVIMRDGAIVVALPGVDDTAVVEDVCNFRIERYGFVEIRNGAVVVAFIEVEGRGC
jgi:hypothetical protein